MEYLIWRNSSRYMASGSMPIRAAAGDEKGIARSIHVVLRLPKIAKDSFGYIQIAVGVAVEVTGMFLGGDGLSTSNSAMRQTWPILLISKFQPWKLYYVDLRHWVAFLIFFIGGIVLAMRGVSWWAESSTIVFLGLPRSASS